MASDLTAAFRTILTEHIGTLPPSARSKSPIRASRGKGKGRASDEDGEDFLKEAYRIHHHLTSLQTLLSSVRKPYLSTVEPPPLSRRAPRPNLQNRSSTSSSYPSDGDRDRDDENEEEEEWKKWERVKYLTDRERDEIDLRARMILRRCKERVGVLERSEHDRKSHSPSSGGSRATATFYSFLPSLAPTSTPSEPLIAAHRLSVLWTLNDFLARLTGTVGGMQEERSKRREERSKTLGGGASAEAARMFKLPPSSSDFGTKTIPDGLVVNVEDPALIPGSASQGGIGILLSTEPPIETILSPTQIQTFESENNALLEHMSSTLSSVLSAETSLLEISQLQSELVRHLSQQTEIVEQLYEDAIGSVGDVGKANEQLKQARKRGEEGRLFLLIFLIGASMALLFLDWYAS